MGRIRSFLSRVTLEGFIVGVVVISIGYTAVELVSHHIQMRAVKAQYQAVR